MTEQRRSKRFELKLPLELLGNGGFTRRENCETRNLSSGGVLFQTSQPFEVGDLIEYRITLPGASAGGRAVRLYCRGKVLRRQTNTTGTANIAATLERYEFVRAEAAFGASARA